MQKKIHKIIQWINTIGNNAIAKFKEAPAHIGNFFKKSETRKAILFLFLFILGLFLVVLLALWAIRALLESLSYVVNFYGIYLLGIFIAFCSILEWINKQKLAAEERKKREMERLLQDAEPIYNYLRNFLYSLLSSNLCRLTDLAKPISPFNLTESPAFHLERDVIFYYFRIEKESDEPLRKGTGYVEKMLQSAITQETHISGIDGITAAVLDPECSVIAVHKVDDLGRNIRVALVFHNDAYRKLMARYGVTPTTSGSLIEHLR